MRNRPNLELTPAEIVVIIGLLMLAGCIAYELGRGLALLID